MFDYEDFYEPSEFEEKAEELKSYLRESVKQEIKDEMEKLRAENKKLQGIKEHFEEVKRDYERKKSECDRVMRDAENKAKKARLSELMEHLEIILWSVSKEWRYKEKCDACDRNRQIEVTLPSGNKVKDKCKCAEHGVVFVIRRMALYELAKRNGELIAWYKECGKEGEEYYICDSITSVPKMIINHDKDFAEIPEDKTVFFTTPEECQQYCDYLNEKAGTTGYIYNSAGEIVVFKEKERPE